ncbi:Dfp1/Him1, central region-domain-containing protein [Chaetomium strumarium]|uniref:Dfp1/Him1, central region-domain-containing protein n=1 Tax=Chaetomium strumarium TaxID=1170767 RepID=A0AAJ0LZG2_9PEZI|nr:Dfp1/Him1, central region-domain-containing protein [Chaetomium strumarium]
MSTRRVPLSYSNPNILNSPARVGSAVGNGIKKGRTHAESVREEPYGQPPPAKRQMIDRGVASPTATRATRAIVHRTASRATGATTATTNRATHTTTYGHTQEELISLQAWTTHTRARFPKMVFYFESIPDELRPKLAKQVSRLGAREEKFFSIDITHVVTTRTIPSEKPKGEQDGRAEGQGDREQPRTIDPSLLNRPADPTRRKLVFDTASSGRPGAPKTRSVDVLDRAREMGKKIWSLEKLQKILKMLLETDPRLAAAGGYDHGSTQSTTTKVATGHPDIKRLLDEERVHGPSDRDPTVPGKELYTFKGYYIYVYDLEEKTKPIMAREFRKGADPTDGEWPQFRSASHGRCPFVIDENYDAAEKEDRERDRARAKARAARAAAEDAVDPAAQQPKASEAPPPKPATGKRTLSQMEDGHNRGMANVRETVLLDRSKISNPPVFDFQSQNAFVSQAKAGRFVAGEPVASGLQPSNITSAIRSQMISSTTGGVLGAKAGTSKEIHGLQRKVVLQRTGTSAQAQDLSSVRRGETSHNGTTFGRSASVTGVTSRRLDPFVDEERLKEQEKLRRTVSVPVSQPKPKRDPKPGYCENCQDKFADFEEHIVSRKHRKFAENDENWTQLDALLSQLKRVPRY